MKRNIYGFIEPYTLGFLLSLIGAGTSLIGNQLDEQVNKETPTEQAQMTTHIESATLNPTKMALIEHDRAK